MRVSEEIKSVFSPSILLFEKGKNSERRRRSETSFSSGSFLPSVYLYLYFILIIFSCLTRIDFLLFLLSSVLSPLLSLSSSFSLSHHLLVDGIYSSPWHDFGTFPLSFSLRTHTQSHRTERERKEEKEK